MGWSRVWLFAASTRTSSRLLHAPQSVALLMRSPCAAVAVHCVCALLLLLPDSCRANRHATAFIALLCIIAFTNALYTPLHLENVALAHPRAAGMQAAGRLPKTWAYASDLGAYSNELQQGTLNLTHSFVTQQTLKHVTHSKRARWWVGGHRLGLAEITLSEPSASSDLAQMTTAAQIQAGSLGHSGSLAAWVVAVETGPWQSNATWGAAAVEELRQAFQGYRKECNDVRRFQATAFKHHYELFRMKVRGDWS